MKNVKLSKLNIKTEKGFTMIDAIAAILIAMLLVGIVGTILYQIADVKLSTKYTSEATIYAIKILEDIDRIDYDEVQSGMEQDYVSELRIPSIYDVTIEVSSYKTNDGQEDKIKQVKLDIKFNVMGRDENLTINKLKVKEA